MLKFIFEDNKNSAISQLLLKSVNSNNFYFSSGNGKIFSVVEEIYNKDDIFIIFFDLNLSKKLPKILKQLKDSLNSEFKGNNIYVVPIPCIEYVVLKMLKDFRYTSLDEVDEVLEFDEFKISGIKGSNYESKMKNFLKSLGNQFVNINIKESSKDLNVFGTFYTEIEDIPNRRAEELYSRLPIIDDLSLTNLEYTNILKDFGINIHKISFSELNTNIQSFYDKMFESFGKSKIEVSIYL